MQSSNNDYNNKTWLDQTRTITINSYHNDHLKYISKVKLLNYYFKKN